MAGTYAYDVALSFAGEDEPYVSQVAHLLRDRGVAVFYHRFEEAGLWGRNLYDALTDVYHKQARFTVMFISEHFARKAWPNVERQAAMARALNERDRYILPARFDNTEIPGLLPTIQYIPAREKSPKDLTDLICETLVQSGATIPSEQLRKDLFSTKPLPKGDPLTPAIRVLSSDGIPIDLASVSAVADNGTVISGQTIHDGTASLDFSVRRTYTVLVSHPDYPGAISADFDPERDLEVRLNRDGTIGSKIFVDGEGQLPGLKGRVIPIYDNLRRTYLYATNIAINDGAPQPVYFSINEALHLEDADGAALWITVKYIRDRTSLIQYIKPPE
jgi:hypothetical protein